ncbi:hypothetical protein FKR81_01390 [Lentzea tibetensis]|uniref:S-adenosyl methyltransferase n=1 Tax=Lentzea tibetensis TaxID=2591470 RepID=A0A563F3A2_9PSEU|nr:SAM-dependent methyltransferase [Lentzea tibetensis]TWP54241.1 hypothetical protein FKR81_01390 [Lentzea tibetensis]
MTTALDSVLTAGVYDHLLGGGYNFALDRVVATRILKIAPQARTWARASRSFVREAVLRMVAAGVRQIIDLGCGVPSVIATHEIAPTCRVLYVDTDPVVVECNRLHIRNQLIADAVQADLRDVGAVMRHWLIDPDEPVGLLMGAVLHHVPDPTSAITEYRARCAPGSLLAASHVSGERLSPVQRQQLARLFSRFGITVADRNSAQFARLLGAWEPSGLLPLPLGYATVAGGVGSRPGGGVRAAAAVERQA